jgi:chemotaxis protein MotB
MKPAYLQSETTGRDRWTVSYLDVLTILLIFFIAAAAKMPMIAKTEAHPKSTRAEVEKKTSQLAGAREMLAGLGIDARMEDRGLVVSLPQTILFASGDDRISESAIPLIEKIADVIQAMPNQVILCGHADSNPIHSRRFRSNWELSAARGLRLLEMLSEKYGIDESRLSVSSDGANRPVASNGTPDGRASNRRVEIVIVADQEFTMQGSS